jgi:hypothetical protein
MLVSKIEVVYSSKMLVLIYRTIWYDFNPEDGGSIFLVNVGTSLQYYMASYQRRP